MAAVTVTFDGWDEFRQALVDLPEELTREGEQVVRNIAEEAGQGVIANYPHGRTGNLRRGVTVRHGRTDFGVRSVVRSAAPHAHLYEKGTKVRQTKKGWNRGVMAAGPDSSRVIPRAIRLRRKMVDQLIVIVKAAGDFEVSEG